MSLHFSLPKMCTLVLVTSFALFLAKKFAPQFLPSWMALSSHFPLPRTYRKRGSASYIVCEVHSVRERERDTERERERERERWKWRHHCRAKIGDEFCTFPCQKMCTLVLATSFALFLATKFAPQFLPSWMALSSHFPLPRTLHFSKRFAFFALSNGVIDRGYRSNKAKDRMSGSTVFLSRRKNRNNESNYYQKLLEIEKKNVREVARGE